MLIKQKNKTGFSLIELLVVISIIGVLSAVLVANFMGARERARDAQKIQDLNGIKNALRLYYNDHQSYPPSEGMNACYSPCLDSNLAPEYIQSISGIGYTYRQTDNGDGFYLQSGLEAGAGNEDTQSQVKCAVGIGDTKDKIFAVCAN